MSAKNLPGDLFVKLETVEEHGIMRKKGKAWNQADARLFRFDEEKCISSQNSCLTNNYIPIYISLILFKSLFISISHQYAT